ncbi:DUF5123 domain-containing protein [Dysgonomonas sp. 511]|uniref:fibronectin type III domain-containing protein n=1 Tax=Dysgonomonas sp. 511 TaxID=2302930 RepID=UPI0013D2BB4B|nr:DUF5123 domain-containing protein [Dysgonomonas sp. 511]NDV78205.1 fibronectin type III domain-containing protein [Dysgonomonas sp. 511]
MKRIIKNIFISMIVIVAANFCLQSCTDDLQDEKDSIELPRLLKPLKVTFGVATLNSVELSWQAAAPSFEVEYCQAEDFAQDVTVVDGITTNKCIIDNLLEDTKYYFRVRGVSETGRPAPSLYSDIVNKSTLAEPAIENIKAVSEMKYTLDPVTVTTIVTVTWGKEGVEPESITSITFTHEDNSPITYPVSAEEAAAQQKVINTGLEVSTEYMIRLYRGTKERGSCQVTTKDGPIPTVEGESKLNYTTNPVTADVSLTWELYMVPAITTVTFTKSGEDTPSLTQPILPADLTAKAKEVTGLDAGTTYIVKLMNGDELVSQSEITTPKAPSANMRIVKPEDGDLREIVVDPSRPDTLFLVPGSYNFTSTATTGIVSKNLVLMGESPATTILKMEKNLVLQGTYDRIAFKNITFNCDAYLMQGTVNSANGQFNIGELSMVNCIVNLASGSSANSTIMTIQARTTGFSAKIGKCTFDNVITYSHSGNTQFTYVQVSASEVNMVFDAITVKNCTSTNTARGIISIGQVSEPVNINVENCTLYNINAGKNTVIYAAKSTKAKIGVKNTVLHFGNTGYKFIDYVAASATVNIENSYFFKGQTPLFNNATAPGNMNMIEYNGTPQDLFASPNVNPMATGASFKIKDADIAAKNVGDPRW